MSKRKRPWLLDKIADLVIVILGITIAFQLGKMQERDKKADEVTYVYNELLSDLESDKEELQNLIKSQNKKLTRLEELAKISPAVAFPVFEACFGPVLAIAQWTVDDLNHNRSRITSPTRIPAIH